MAQALQIPSSPSGAAAAPMLTAGFDTVGVGDVFVIPIVLVDIISNVERRRY
jgi:hypothetical protein